MSAFLHGQGTSPVPSSVVPIQPSGNNTPLFCVHPGGGMVNCYVPLARALGPEQPLYGLESYGFGKAEIPRTQIEEMAAAYIADLLRIQPEPPFQLAGWSLGGVVAYEMALQLIRSGKEVSLLSMFDAEPNLFRRPGRNEPAWDVSLSERLQELLIKDGVPGKDIGSLPSQERISLLLDRWKTAGRLSSCTTEDQLRQFLRVWLTNEAAKRRYVMVPLPVRIVLFRSTLGNHNDEDYKWSDLAMGGVDVYQYPVDHDDFMSPPNAQKIAAVLRNYLARSTAAPDDQAVATVAAKSR
jgi:thioesterase domain-containing protein